MHRIRERLALSRVAKPAFCAVLIGLFAFAARAEETVTVHGGGAVTYDGASATNWIYNSSTKAYDFVLIFTNPAVGNASFTFPEGRTKARILAVGGGGGGGGSASSPGKGRPNGGGGGGGAGGVSETNDVFTAGEYAVVVGAGGAGGVRAGHPYTTPPSVDYSGKDGGETSVTGGSFSLVAGGGGAGGGETDGHDGASGGGGSIYRKSGTDTVGEVHYGGSPNGKGLGHKGGDGDANNKGGGGGGAGGAGAAASAGGAGGDGVACDITGTSVTYGGGGGGGNNYNGTTDAAASGGAGGGGTGGVDTTAPTVGVDGLGGGGGGGSRTADGARGGDGVVIIRISAAMDGDLNAPVAPDPIEFDGNAHTSIVSTLFYTVTGDNVGTTAGVYKATATLAPGMRWMDKTGDEATNPVQVTMTILKRAVTFSNLRLRDWIYGTPEESTPNPQCDVSPFWVVPVYEYADSADASSWSSVKPTVVGAHYVRVRPPNDDDYSYTPTTAQFNIVSGPGGQFTDYVDLTVAAKSGAPLAEFPYEITISEKLPQNGLAYPDGTEYTVGELVGFLYSRAGLTGDDIAFTDAGGNVLPFKVKAWNPGGDTTIHVKVPMIAGSEQVIRLYWHLRDGQIAPDHYPDTVFSTWTEEAAAAAGQPGCSFGFVSKDGVVVNYFTQLPAMDKQSWAAGETPGVVNRPAVLADGASVTMAVFDAAGNEQSGIPADAPGAYRAVFAPATSGEYEELAYFIDFSISGDMATSDLSGGIEGEFALTANGRVMLVNDDAGDPSHPAVKGQAYWRSSENSPEIYWTHSGSHEIGLTVATTLPGTQHILHYVDADGVDAVLWRIFDGVIGNGRVGDNIVSGRAVLPNSLTGLGNASYDVRNTRGDVKQAGNVIFRNVVGAVVYSPCYTNGIGTIYFDAVNHSVVTSDAEALWNQIVVEVATETDDDKEPTDENAGWSGVSPSNISDAKWERVAMLPLKRDNTASFVVEAKTSVLSLGVRTMQSSENFYRVCASVESRGPSRFRIRRVSRNDDKTVGIDGGSLILLDNIIVSYPSCIADMKPFGKYDGTRGGKQTLGQECAMANVAFPSVSDAANLLGRGTVATFVSPIAPNASAASFVQTATMHYRWRYLNQAFDPADGSWRSVDLRPQNGFKATAPLEVPAAPGDVEFWYELATTMPYYMYTDYSGANLGLGKLYTEEKAAVTNRFGASGLASGGSDWFVRLREGASEWEGIDVVLSGGGYGAGSRVPMELVSDHVWRGLAKVPQGSTAGYADFRFEGANRQGVPGSQTVEENTTSWCAMSDVAGLPARGEAHESVASRSYPSDAASGYIEFTFNDETLAYSIGHAEFQDFNAWHDAKRDQFMGTYAETSGVSSAVMVKTNANMNAWPTLTTENVDWDEPFSLTDYTDAGFPKGVRFSSHKMPQDAWSGDSGMFVDAKLVGSGGDERKKNSGIAWQMDGEGAGNISFTSDSGPNGLDAVTFQARLAQSISFDDFSVWYGDGSSATNNYTLVVPALMSSSSTQTSQDYAPGASMSVVAYYAPKKGCYEARVTRESNDGITIAIYKWHLKGYKVVCDDEPLVEQFFKNYSCEISTGGSAPNMYAILLSVANESGGTRIIVGLTTVASDPMSADYSGSKDGVYNLVAYTDSASDKLTKGSYGVLSASCNGMFHYPRQRSEPILSSTVPAAGWKGSTTVELKGDSDASTCRKRLTEAWAYTPGRAEWAKFDAYSGNVKPEGIVVPAGLTQTVDVFLKDRSASSWTYYTNATVSSYRFTSHSVAVRTNANCHVRLAAGEMPVGVTVWDIKQTAWNGEDYSNIDNTSGDFVYTQARVIKEVSDDKTVTNRYTMLQPARALPGKALSIRSPVLTNGLGMVGFSYKDLKPGCEVWLQAATNDVRRNLAGSSGYNFTTNEVALGASEPVGRWITLRKCTYDELAAADGQMTYYCGWHSSRSRMLEGVFRIVIAPNVVAAAQGEDDVEWGALTVTGMWVHDEPAIDTKSWIGWNLRTIGDGSDSERRMLLIDGRLGEDGETGLSAGLNNSTSADIAGDPSEYDDINPTIQSPTFGEYTDAKGETRTAAIGQVRFRARLYETNATAAAAKPATLTLYGAADGSEDNWTALTNYTVESTVYRIFSYSAPSGRYSAMRFAINGVIGGAYDGDRVLLEEIVVSERPEAAVSFVYARPFRTGIAADKVIGNILSPDQQPLTDESWGVQTRLKFDRTSGDIDVEKGFKVFFRYFVGEKPWGHDGGWESESAASDWAELVQVGDPDDYIFRSTISNPKTIVSTIGETTTVVQYALKVRYWVSGADGPSEDPIEAGTIDDTEDGDGWTNPAWYSPVDYNADSLHGGGDKDKFVPYTILDPVSPRRVWINEVNYNDGPKAQNGNAKSVTNQFVEIAVPWGVNLKGWKLRLTDYNKRSLDIAKLGAGGVPASKSSANRSGDYDFLVIQSPNSTIAEADGKWVSDTLNGTFKSGVLQYDCPYQFELVRPSGVIEHQIVVEGTNEWRSYSSGYIYDGTNLVNMLDAVDQSEKRFFAGEEKARKADGTTFSSLGVTGGAHGEDGGWTAEMRFTPGRLNEGQDELYDWYLRPMGAAVSIFARVTGPHVGQTLGEETGQDIHVIVGSGTSTYITYSIAPWYAISNITVNGAAVAGSEGATGTYRLNLNNVTETTHVVASESIDPNLIGDNLIDPADRYTPAILNWLSSGKSNGKDFENPNGPVTLGYYKGLGENDAVTNLSLKAMYWLDLDPTRSNWWVRSGFTAGPSEVKRKWRLNADTTLHLKDRTMTIKMFYSNETGRTGLEVRRPTRLQGLGGEMSDTFTGNWTSETFKVLGQQNNGLPLNKGFLPLRSFVFNGDSFDSTTYEAVIEVLDPLSAQSAGHSYGWDSVGIDNFWFKYTIEEPMQTGAPVEMLKKNSSYNLPLDN